MCKWFSRFTCHHLVLIFITFKQKYSCFHTHVRRERDRSKAPKDREAPLWSQYCYPTPTPPPPPQPIAYALLPARLQTRKPPLLADLNCPQRKTIHDPSPTKRFRSRYTTKIGIRRLSWLVLYPCGVPT